MKFWGQAGSIGLVIIGLGLGGCGSEVSGPDRGASSKEREAEKTGGPEAKIMKVEVVWPTPNTAFAEGGGPETYLQPTASGRVISGSFGSVRNGGWRFHEGLDLKPVKRDAKGEAADPIFAAMAGVVRHVSAKSGGSNYGRYVVLEHPDQSPPVYTLYAHLANIAPEVTVGREMAAGEVLGLMGRSTSGEPIPRERAHLHFEVGLRMTDSFAAWYRKRGFGSVNEHGVWNGMNLAGIDPLAVFEAARSGGLTSLDQIFEATPIAVTLRVARGEVPDFVRRYPSLASGWKPGGPADKNPAGWEIGFSVSGLPIRWKALGAGELAGFRTGERRVVGFDRELLKANPARRLVTEAKGTAAPGRDLEQALEQLFGGS